MVVKARRGFKAQFSRASQSCRCLTVPAACGHAWGKALPQPLALCAAAKRGAFQREKKRLQA